MAPGALATADTTLALRGGSAAQRGCQSGQGSRPCRADWNCRATKDSTAQQGPASKPQSHPTHSRRSAGSPGFQALLQCGQQLGRRLDPDGEGRGAPHQVRLSRAQHLAASAQWEGTTFVTLYPPPDIHCPRLCLPACLPGRAGREIAAAHVELERRAGSVCADCTRGRLERLAAPLPAQNSAWPSPKGM